MLAVQIYHKVLLSSEKIKIPHIIRREIKSSSEAAKIYNKDKFSTHETEEGKRNSC